MGSKLKSGGGLERHTGHGGPGLRTAVPRPTGAGARRGHRGVFVWPWDPVANVRFTASPTRSKHAGDEAASTHIRPLLTPGGRRRRRAPQRPGRTLIPNIGSRVTLPSPHVAATRVGPPHPRAPCPRDALPPGRPSRAGPMPNVWPIVPGPQGASAPQTQDSYLAACKTQHQNQRRRSQRAKAA